MKEQLLQKAKPILFNTKMVKAILDGRKTQTRRIAKLENIDCPYCEDYLVPYGWTNDMEIGYQCINEDCMHITSINQKPKYKVGDILYVKETFAVKENGRILYKADYEDGFDIKYHWRTEWSKSIHLKQKDVRIFLKVTNVIVERLQDMKIEDFLDEGVMDKEFIVSNPDNGLNEYYKYLKNKWVNLWDSTAKDGYKWEDNPYVFVYDFEKVEVC